MATDCRCGLIFPTSAWATGEVSREAVVAEMVGAVAAPPARAAPAGGDVLLAVEHLDVFDPDRPERRRVEGLSFSVRAGETVGLFGLVGAGCSEAALAVKPVADDE